MPTILDDVGVVELAQGVDLRVVAVRVGGVGAAVHVHCAGYLCRGKSRNRRFPGRRVGARLAVRFEGPRPKMTLCLSKPLGLKSSKKCAFLSGVQEPQINLQISSAQENKAFWHVPNTPLCCLVVRKVDQILQVGGDMH